MAGRVGNVDASGEHRDGETVGGERRTVRGAVDAIRAARHHRHIALDEACGQFGRHVFAVGRARSGSDDRGGTFGHVVEASRADNPQGQRRMSLRPQLTVHACERRERQQGPLIIAGRDQAAAMAIKHLEIFCRAIDPAAGFSAAGQVRR